MGNIDNDNIIGSDFAVDVVSKFRQGCTVVQYGAGVDGTCGRLAYTRKDFHFLGGYDEDAYPMCAQDVDLRRRLKDLPGAWLVTDRSRAFGIAIPNSIEQKIEHCDPPHGISWPQMDAVNAAVFALRRQ